MPVTPTRNLSVRKKGGRLFVLNLDFSLPLYRRLEAHAIRNGDRLAAVALDAIEQFLDESDAWDMAETMRERAS